MSRKTRKLIWAAPLVAVFAVVGALALFMTLTPNSALAQQGEAAPGMPTDLNLRALDQTTVELTWKAPADDAGGIPDGYRIDYSADGLIWYSLVPNHSTLKYVDNHDLEASEERYYRIFAFNTGGSSDMLGPMSTMTTASTKPEAPTALVVNPGVDVTGEVNDANEEHLVISWDPPVDPPGAPVTEFRLQVSKSSSGPFINLKGAEALKAKDVCSGTGASRQCTHTDVDLFENTAQWYRVYATNKLGEGPASEIRGDETDEGAIPTTPRNLRAALSTAGRMALYWDRPAETTDNTGKHDPPGAPITGYYIQGGPVASDAATPSEFVDRTTGTALTNQNPRTNQVYYYSAGTDVPLTSTILNRLDDFAGAPGVYDPNTPDDTSDDITTHWGFRVMAINSVVERRVADGTITPDATTPANGDGIWSDMIRVNNDATLADVLPKPTLEADRHTASNRGRTGIELEWKVTGAVANTTQYRVEYSKDRIDWTVLPNTDATMFAAPATTTGDPPTGVVAATATDGVHVGLTASTRYSYRVFAVQPSAAGAPAGRIYTEASGPVSETTTTADRPNPPDLTAPVAASETELRMTVLVDEAAADDNEDPDTPGAESGDIDVGFGELKGYRIEISDDGRDWTKYDPVMIGAKLDVIYSYSEKDKEVTEEERDAGETVEFRHTDLTQKSTRYYRASTVNNAPGSSAYSVATDPAMKGTTDASLTSDDPGGLVAKANSRTSIELFWNARADDIEAAKVEKYKIEYSAVNDDGECAEEWMTAEEETDTSATYYEHTGLMAGTGYCYRIFGINVVGTSTSFVGFGDAYAATYDSDAQAMTHPIVVSDAPTGVTATANSDTQITVEWMAPADNGGADITGYIIERRYTGDMMGDIPSDGYNAAAGGASFAFSNHMEWWETLNCKGMLAAAGSSETPAAAGATKSADEMMYCAHYADTAPTNMAGTITAGDATDTAIKALFDKRYELPTGTATTFVDMGLTEQTEYTYRVSAVNSVGRSMWSAADSATTEASNTDPEVATTIQDQTVTAGESKAVDVSESFSDADEDELAYDATSDDEAIATVAVNGAMVTISGVSAGTANITVTASDGMGGEDATQTFRVTVEAANVAPVPSDDPGLVLPSSVSLIVGGDDEVITLTGSFTDSDGDTVMYSAMSDDTAIATATVSDDGSMLTIAPVAAGMATVTVTANDGNGGTATHDIAVTVAVELMAPRITGTNPVGSGIILVSWNPVAGATGYSLIATNLSDTSAPTRTAAAGADDRSGQIQNLTAGDKYLIFVGAFNDDLAFKLSNYVEVTTDP